MEKDILSVDETADYLGVQRLFVIKAIKEGKLKASKLGKLWKIQRKDIQEYLDNNKN
jgi:excisionase family DNA binding protein